MKNLIKNLQLGLLIIILISTIIAVFIEIINMYKTQSVTLADGTVIKQRSMMPLSVQQPNKDIVLHSNIGTVTVAIS